MSETEANAPTAEEIKGTKRAAEVSFSFYSKILREISINLSKDAEAHNSVKKWKH